MTTSLCRAAFKPGAFLPFVLFMVLLGSGPGAMPPVYGAECEGGSCSIQLPGAAPGSTPGGGSLSSSSARSMERDWRTRLLLENLSRDGYDDADSAGAMAPIIGRQESEPRTLQLTYFASFQVSQYPPFSDEREMKDTEFSTEVAVDALYPLNDETELLGRLSLRNEWSKDDPKTFPRYDVRIYRFDGGVRHQFTEEFSGTLKLGTFYLEGGSDGDPPGGTPDPELLYSAELEYATEGYSIRGGTYRDVFGSPDSEGYKLERLYVDYLDANVRVLERLNLNIRGNHLRFTDDSEDYESLTGLLTYYPSLEHRLGLSLGASQEFREEDETLWIGGVEWMRPLSERNSFFTNTRFYANTTTREREVTSEIILGRTGKTGKHGGAIGLSVQWEYNVYDRYSTFLFLRVY